MKREKGEKERRDEKRREEKRREYLEGGGGRVEESEADEILFAFSARGEGRI